MVFYANVNIVLWVIYNKIVFIHKKTSSNILADIIIHQPHFTPKGKNQLISINIDIQVVFIDERMNEWMNDWIEWFRSTIGIDLIND